MVDVAANYYSEFEQDGIIFSPLSLQIFPGVKIPFKITAMQRDLNLKSRPCHESQFLNYKAQLSHF